MKCYISGINDAKDLQTSVPGLVSFAIPDLGVQFRARHEGTRNDCAYSALLVFLRFVENNPQLFKDRRIEILTDSPTVACQVNRLAPVGELEKKHYALVESHRKRQEFGLKWVPSEENEARSGILHIAPLDAKVKINLKPIDPPGSSLSAAGDEPRK